MIPLTFDAAILNEFAGTFLEFYVVHLCGAAGCTA